MKDNMVLLQDGSWVSENFTLLSEILADYDPLLELRWIPPDKRETQFEKANPYVIVDTRSNSAVRYVSERDEPRLVLAEIFDMDNVKGDVIKKMDARNAADQAFRMKKVMEEREEAKDFTRFVVANKKNYIRHNGKTLDDELRPISERPRSY